MGHSVKPCCVDGVSFARRYQSSAGHLIDLRAAPQVITAYAIRYPLPEPTRLADQLVGVAKRAVG